MTMRYNIPGGTYTVGARMHRDGEGTREYLEWSFVLERHGFPASFLNLFQERQSEKSEPPYYSNKEAFKKKIILVCQSY